MHHAALLSALALFSAVSAVPVKRDVEVETVTEVDYVFQMVTATVWVDPTDPVTTEIPKYTTAAAAPTTTTSAVQVAQYKAPPPPPPPAPTTSSSTTPVALPPPPPTTSTSTTAAPPPPPPPPPAPTTTSVYQPPQQPAYVPPPPAPTTSTAPAPAPSPEAPPPPPPAPTTTAQAAPSSAPSSGSGSSSPKGTTYTGEITYYAVGLGSCGNTNSDSEMVVAMSAAMMNKATMCGKSITLSYQGVTQTATVVDTCPGCASGSLDLSPSLFKAIAPNGDGRVHGVEWWFN